MSTPPPDSDQPTKQPFSALAAVGLVLGVIPCCPLVNLIGATMGVLALRRISASGGRLRGRRAARIAVVAGLSLTALSSLAFMQFSATYQRRNERVMTEALEGFIDAAQKGEAETARELWVNRAPARPEIDDFARFGAALAERYGPLDRVEMASLEIIGDLLDTRFEAAVFVYFAGDDARTGSARFQAVVVPGRVWPDFLLIGLTIDDEERGDLALPVVVAE